MDNDFLNLFPLSKARIGLFNILPYAVVLLVLAFFNGRELDIVT